LQKSPIFLQKSQLKSAGFYILERKRRVVYPRWMTSSAPGYFGRAGLFLFVEENFCLDSGGLQVARGGSGAKPTRLLRAQAPLHIQ